MLPKKIIELDQDMFRKVMLLVAIKDSSLQWMDITVVSLHRTHSDVAFRLPTWFNDERHKVLVSTIGWRVDCLIKIIRGIRNY